MRILFCGDRNWSNKKSIIRELRMLPVGTVIIYGNARGADKIAGFYAKQFGFEVLSFPADWNQYGKAAGPIRNQQMLDEGRPDMIYAFHSNIETSKGTKDMVNRGRKAGIPIKIFTS